MTDAVIVAAVAALAAGFFVLLRQQRLIRRRQRGLDARLRRLERDRLLALERDAAAREVHERAARGELDLRLPFAFTGEEGEDLFLWRVFEGQPTGRYLEIGAFDGTTCAVSYPFECVGWTGLLVEPNPRHATLCRARRPHSTVVEAAASRRGSSGTIRLRVPGGDAIGGLSGFLETDTHGRDETLARRGVRPDEFEARLTTLADILDEHPGRLDFAVLDVEGHEPELLDGIDLARHRPRLFLIEDLSEGRDRTVRDTMLAAGYRHAGRVGMSEVYVEGGEADLLARALRHARPES